MKNSHLATAGVLGLLAGFGAVYLVWSQKHPGAPSGAAGEQASQEPLSVSSRAQDPVRMAAPDPNPASDPANARGAPGQRAQGGIARLETGYDLSKVKLPYAGISPEDTQEVDPGATAQEPWTGLLPAGKADRNKGRVALAEGQQSHDFGLVRQGEVGSHEFLLVSDGEEPLVINAIKPSCGCTKADISLLGADGSRTPYVKGQPIPVEQRFVLETEINTDGRSGPFSAQVVLYANDARGVFSVRLAANIEPVLTVTPSPSILFGRMTTADRAEQVVTVKATRGETFLLAPDPAAQVEPLTVEYAPRNPDDGGRSAEWEIKVALGPDIPIGMRNYPVRLVSDLPIAHPKYKSQDGSVQNHAVMLNVQAHVSGLVSAEPAFLTFGMVKPGEAVERSVRIECHDPFKLTEAIPVSIEGLQGQDFPFASAFTTSLVPLEDGRAADLKVRLEGLPPDLNGSFGGVLRIQVAHPSMNELLVRFSGVCRPALPAAGGK